MTSSPLRCGHHIWNPPTESIWVAQRLLDLDDFEDAENRARFPAFKDTQLELSIQRGGRS